MLGRVLAMPMVLFVTVFSPGCAGPTNPSFPLSAEEARADLERMRREPLPAARPILVLGGYADPGFATSHIRNRMRPRLQGATILTVSFGDRRSIEAAAERLFEKIDRAVASGELREDAEFDVVASSMGGLIARYAATPRGGGRTLRVARIFTICTPHVGASAAETFTWTALMRQLAPGSAFIEALNHPETARPYEVIPYARLGDALVGEENTAPPGEIPWWTPDVPFLSGHFTAFDDPRINADILRRLRGEAPFTTEPRSPLPGN